MRVHACAAWVKGLLLSSASRLDQHDLQPSKITLVAKVLPLLATYACAHDWINMLDATGLFD